jgi:hypothetical protein
MALQQRIDMAKNRPGTRTNKSAVVSHIGAVPVPADVNKNIVRLRLPIQTCAYRPKSGVSSAFPTVTKYLDNVLGCARQYDNLWHQAIWACVGGIANKIYCSMKHSVLAEQTNEIRL